MAGVIAAVSGVIFILIGLTGLKAKTPPGKGTHRGATVTVLFVVGGLLLGVGFSYRLGANEVGVPVTFGRIGTPTGPGGIYLKRPWTSVEKMTVLPYTPDEDADVTLRTADGGQFSARFRARWHTTREAAADLYRNRRTSDEATITKQVVQPLLAGVASERAKALGNDATYDPNDSTKVIIQGVATTSPLAFGRQVQDALAPLLAEKGIVLDDVIVVGDFTISKEMNDALNAQAAQRAKTKRAREDVATAKQEADAARERAAGQSDAIAKIPVTLTPAQAQVLCSRTWAEEVRRATEKGIAMYTNPCGSGENLLVGAK